MSSQYVDSVGVSHIWNETKELVTQAKSNLNLLDNWYFVDPINQREKTEYIEKSYTIDRWANLIEGMSVSLTESGLHIISNNNLNFSQPVMTIEHAKKKYKGLTLTLSFLLSTGLTSVSYSFTGDENSLDVGGNNVSGVVSNMWFNTRSSTFTCNLYGDSPSDVYLIAAKLEIGDKQTLGHQDVNGLWVLNDPPPNEALELMKCQRYFERVRLPLGFVLNRAPNNRLVANVFYKTQKINKPIVHYYPMMIVRWSDNASVYGTSGATPSETTAVGSNAIRLLFSKDQLNKVELGDCAYIGAGYGIDTCHIDIDADLK